jgi:hypothetical protein
MAEMSASGNYRMAEGKRIYEMKKKAAKLADTGTGLVATPQRVSLSDLIIRDYLSFKSGKITVQEARARRAEMRKAMKKASE